MKRLVDEGKYADMTIACLGREIQRPRVVKELTNPKSWRVMHFSRWTKVRILLPYVKYKVKSLCTLQKS